MAFTAKEKDVTIISETFLNSGWEDTKMAFTIIRNDITKVTADAIVNTANPHPVIGGGTDSAVYAAAGAEALLEKRREIGDILPGNVAATPAFHLNAKWILHTVGPSWEGGEAGEFETLRNCYRNSLKLASELKCESIAFPLIATGVYGFPKAEALQIAVSEFRAFLENAEMEITLVVFDRESFVLSDAAFEGVNAFVDGNYVEEKLDSEYAVPNEVTRAQAIADAEMESVARRNIFERIFHKSSVDTAPAHNFSGKNKKAIPEGTLGSACEESLPEENFTKAKVVFEDAEDISEEEEIFEPDGAPLKDSSVFASKISSPRSLDDVMAQVGETWQESLLRLIDEKGFTDTEVYKRANVDRKLFSKIRSNKDYQPKKITAVAFALALNLNLDETKDLLGRAGYAFSPGSRFDLIVEYYIEQEVYDFYTINLALFDHDQPLIGA